MFSGLNIDKSNQTMHCYFFPAPQIPVIISPTQCVVRDGKVQSIDEMYNRNCR